MTTWKIVYESFEPEEERLREALTSTGNGYFATRGTAEWAEEGEVHYPGTYTHGGFNRETTIMAGRPVLNEDLVNLPDWLPLKLMIEGEEPISLDNVEVLDYRHEYDIRTATVSRHLRVRDRADRETTLESRRFVSMENMHLAAIEWTVTPENWSGNVEVLTALSTQVGNRGVARYGDLESRHLNPITTRQAGEDTLSLVAETRQSRIRIAEAARTRVYSGDGEVAADRRLYRMEDYIHQLIPFEVREGEPFRVEKLVSFYTSRDHAINEPLVNAVKAVGRFGTFEETYGLHARAWDELWSACDVQIPGDDHVQQLVRFHISHVLQVCSPHTASLDAGVPARGLNGEAYRGHIFWDELYIYPFLNYRLPEVTREFLVYRHRRLGEARHAAAEAGFRGAMYPWQSGSDGTEETQTVHLNPNSGKWDPDLSHNQRHVNAAIFYNIWRFYQTTGDFEFLLAYGAEMMLEIARFWASIAHHNPERERYEIHGVMGPDEFHEKYPGSDEEGLHNNAYTNVMVAWISETAVHVLDMLPERRRRSLTERIGLTEDDVQLWNDMSHKMFVPFHGGDDGEPVISQFEGYGDLEELDWDHYRKEYDNIQRMDRILKAEGEDPDRYKLSKQADVVMLFYLFPEDELRGLFDRLGYDFGPDTARRNIEYYEPRTTHGSTLSLVVHAAVLADLDPESSWERFVGALESDIGDIQGGTTSEGIHMGVMAGTLDLVQRGYLGANIKDSTLFFAPELTDRLDGLSMPMRFRGTPMEVTLKGGRLIVEALPEGPRESIKVGADSEVEEIEEGSSHTFDL